MTPGASLRRTGGRASGVMGPPGQGAALRIKTVKAASLARYQGTLGQKLSRASRTSLPLKVAVQLLLKATSRPLPFRRNRAAWQTPDGRGGIDECTLVLYVGVTVMWLHTAGGMSAP